MPTYPREKDGLTPAERQAYAACNWLSCKHEACFKKYMYRSIEVRDENCAGLFADWKKCFDAELERAKNEATNPPSNGDAESSGQKRPANVCAMSAVNKQQARTTTTQHEPQRENEDEEQEYYCEGYSLGDVDEIVPNIDRTKVTPIPSLERRRDDDHDDDDCNQEYYNEGYAAGGTRALEPPKEVTSNEREYYNEGYAVGDADEEEKYPDGYANVYINPLVRAEREVEAHPEEQERYNEGYAVEGSRRVNK